ncbi:MAG: tetratricopeptide repeat protein [Prolixibacteraceae bacterium]|nr:tetratricopeptide repeat protein [Prolixibacteraceae bacterium]MBN2650285.1 tetratricopeptide repeat protein [Prolixibacteraceae bacterium]
MNKLFLLILSLFVVLISTASPADSLQKANEAYAANEFEKAVSLYESILDSGYESSELYFNLGNAYYKSNQLPKAILNYERARLLNPKDEDIQFNLELANQFVVDKIEALPRPFLAKWGNSLVNTFTSNQWAFTSIASFVLMLTLALVYLLSRRIGFRKLAFALSIVFLLISIASFVFSYQQKNKIIQHNHAIIFNPTVTVKASPDDSGTDLFVIHEGLKVSIEQKLDNWVEIKIEDGNSGWIKNEVMEEI